MSDRFPGTCVIRRTRARINLNFQQLPPPLISHVNTAWRSGISSVKKRGAESIWNKQHARINTSKLIYTLAAPFVAPLPRAVSHRRRWVSRNRWLKGSFSFRIPSNPSNRNDTVEGAVDWIVDVGSYKWRNIDGAHTVSLVPGSCQTGIVLRLVAF